jgi:hypothetical protein
MTEIDFIEFKFSSTSGPAKKLGIGYCFYFGKKADDYIEEGAYIHKKENIVANFGTLSMAKRFDIDNMGVQPFIAQFVLRLIPVSRVCQRCSPATFSAMRRSFAAGRLSNATR